MKAAPGAADHVVAELAGTITGARPPCGETGCPIQFSLLVLSRPIQSVLTIYHAALGSQPATKALQERGDWLLDAAQLWAANTGECREA